MAVGGVEEEGGEAVPNDSVLRVAFISEAIQPYPRFPNTSMIWDEGADSAITIKAYYTRLRISMERIGDNYYSSKAVLAQHVPENHRMESVVY